MAAPEFLSVPPVEAVEHFRAKGYVVGFDWRDVDAATHARAFTAAKAMRQDILEDLREAVDAAIAEGLTFRQFQERLEPVLRSKGWWGRQEMVDPLTGEKRLVQLGSPRRLRTIFDTNLRMSGAYGRWERTQRLKQAMPYLRYVSVLDARTRPEHAAWHGTVLPVDHPFWHTHYPPNGWHCRCTVVQLSERDLQRYGFEVSPDPALQTRSWFNARTGQTAQVPRGIDPGFQHNAGRVGRGFDLADPNSIPELDEATALHAKIADATGSNPGGMYRGLDGQRRYVKFYDDPAQAYSEAVANRAYRELGLDAPRSAIVRAADGSIRGVASDLVEHQTTLGRLPIRQRRADEVLKGFSADVWLANWDALGLDLDNVVVVNPRRHKIARIDQGGSLLFRARAGRKPLDRLRTLSEWDGFANSSRNPAYARIFQAAGVDPDGLGRRALRQIAAIRELGRRTDGFADLVPVVRGIADEDRAAILRLLRDRARLLDSDIVPRVKAALRAGDGLPAHEAGFVRRLGSRYRSFLDRALAKITATGYGQRYGLSDAEIAARYAYTTSDGTWGYRKFNAALRSRDPHKVAAFADYRDTLNAALAKLPDHRDTVRRRTRLAANELAVYRVGDVVTEEGFTSSSVGQAAFGGPVEFVIESLHGKRIQSWSAFPGEREVLFAAGTRFRVLQVEQHGGGRYTVYLREVE